MEKLIWAGLDSGTLTLEQLQGRYHILPDGTNFYYGINEKNLTDAPRNKALKAEHQAFLANLVASPKTEIRVVLGLEPPANRKEAGRDHHEPIDPFGYVHENLELVRMLARELHDQPRKLKFVIRYASEMNDPKVDEHTHERVGWGGLPTQQFKDSHREVREIFRELAPEIEFAFSPGLRADLRSRTPSIHDYRPDLTDFEYCAGTWYVGKRTDFVQSCHHMHEYITAFSTLGKRLALDEVGGRDADPGQGDPRIDLTLIDMLNKLKETLAGRQLIYMTTFVEKKWGARGTGEDKDPPGHEPDLAFLPDLHLA